MGIGGQLLSFVRESKTEIHECRHCGTSVDDPNEGCPSCGESDIATFEL